MRALKIREMLRTIEREARLTAHLTGRARFSPTVMEALGEIPRDAFVPEELMRHAFDNGPLPIGLGQTISQPYIVALMTDLLEPQPHHIDLEVGTGSGYQAAILAQLVEQVYSLEIIPELAEEAEELLARLEYHNVEIRVGDGHSGWPEQAPFDGIIVTAAASHIPPALTDQLKAGGRLVIPLGSPYGAQELLLIEKDRGGELHTRDILGVAFVPMTGGVRAGSEDKDA